ncbi:hypothetical protein DICPUDRAFT_77327 [Dictyostelium purpureum]|uniref:Uncharacterized protein n=1 Tax=Dictyostelium purpureum TaxID=5786 RepID=F0ZGA2_DICPU|nr:uncharacterized protein DICPUDRAFT_77327 [Dictyostelium purpureum]EGC37025.1 hypothetical protein DICPUDRAFT_77327 [Dictyostelium purpureum]|eukprot:XP_003286453.1 hypothetical protein DICPUDRAFT_77327 [Dictyostelium purpureum]
MINENSLVDIFAYYTKINYSPYEIDGEYKFVETLNFYNNKYTIDRNNLIKKILEDLKSIINQNPTISNNRTPQTHKYYEFNNYKLITKYSYTDINSISDSIIPYDEAISFFENNIKSNNEIIRLISILEFFQYFMNKHHRNQIEFYRFLTKVFYDPSPYIPTTLNFFKSRFINYNFILISYIFNNIEMCDWLFNCCKDEDINKRIDSLINPRDILINIDSLASFISKKCIPISNNQIKFLDKIKNHLNTFLIDKTFYYKINDIINNQHRKINKNNSGSNNEIISNNNVFYIYKLKDSIITNIIDKLININLCNINDIIISLALVSKKFFNLLKDYIRNFNWNRENISTIIKSHFNGDSKFCLLEDSIIVNNYIYYETIIATTPYEKINKVFSSLESISINYSLFTSPTCSKYGIQYDFLDNSFFIHPPSTGMKSLKSIEVIGNVEDYIQPNTHELYQSRNLNLIKYITIHCSCKLEKLIYSPIISNNQIDTKLISTILRYHHSTLKSIIIKINQGEFKSSIIQFILNLVNYYYPNIKLIFNYKNSNTDYDFSKDLNNININNYTPNFNNNNHNYSINNYNYNISSSNDSTLEEESDMQSIDDNQNDNDDYEDEFYVDDYQDFEYDDNYNHNFEEFV